jgi:hypothetical protein
MWRCENEKMWKLETRNWVIKTTYCLVARGFISIDCLENMQMKKCENSKLSKYEI